MVKPDLPRELTDYLHSQKLMSIATHSGEPWIACVYYVLDDRYNFYFISSPETQHIKAININPEVAVSIADSAQEVTDEKVGVQFTGTVSEVSRLESVKWFFKMFNKLNPGVSDFLNVENYKSKLISSKVYKVTPKKIQFFHEGLYADAPIEATKMFIIKE